MAYNALYGFDTSQPLGTSMAPSYNAYNPRTGAPPFGSYTEGTMAPSYAAYATPANRQYPKWMTDITARGIGVGQDWTGSTPAPINVPRGDGSGGFGGAVAAPMVPNVPQYVGQAGGERGGNMAEGGGANPGFGGDGVTGFAGGGGSYSFGDLLSALGFGDGGKTGSISDSLSGPNAYDGSYGPQQPGTAGGYGEQGGGMQDGQGPTGNEIVGADMNASAGNENASAGPSAAMADAGFSHGGHVTRNRLQGPDPDGPDDGYGALNIGEGIITAKAMKHYGKGILSRLNKLQVPKEAFGKK